MFEGIDVEKTGVVGLSLGMATVLLGIIRWFAMEMLKRMDRQTEVLEEMRDVLIAIEYNNETRHGIVMAKLRGDETPLEIPRPSPAEIRQNPGLYGIRGGLSRKKPGG